jgi:hypothetical protein
MKSIALVLETRFFDDALKRQVEALRAAGAVMTLRSG